MLGNTLNLKDLFFLKSVLISNFKRLNFPLKISYAVTYKCNLKCRICNIWKKDAKERELSLSEIESFFRCARKFYWVGITGGEPFLREDLAELVDIITFYSERLTALHFSTNGSMPEKILSLVEYIQRKNKKPRIVFTVSIDGPKGAHDSIRGREGAWENAVNTFKQLKKMKRVKVQAGFTLSSHNLGLFRDTLAGIKEFFPPLKFDDININIFQKSRIYYDNLDMPYPAQNRVLNETREILDMDRDGFSINNFLRRHYLKLYPRYIRTNRYPIKCQALSSTCFLDPYGNLFPCPVYEQKLFNVRQMQEDLGRIWNKAPARKLSADCLRNNCPSCWSPCDAFSAIGGSLLQALFRR